MIAARWLRYAYAPHGLAHIVDVRAERRTLCGKGVLAGWGIGDAPRHAARAGCSPCKRIAKRRYQLR